MKNSAETAIDGSMNAVSALVTGRFEQPEELVAGMARLFYEEVC